MKTQFSTKALYFSMQIRDDVTLTKLSFKIVTCTQNHIVSETLSGICIAEINWFCRKLCFHSIWTFQ